MDERTALHLAARRYCFNRLPALTPEHYEREYRELGFLDRLYENEGTKAQWETIPGILFNIDRVKPESFPSTEALRIHLMHIGQTASIDDKYETEDFEDDGTNEFGDEETAEADEDENGEDEDEDLWDYEEDEPEEDPEQTEREIIQERALFCTYIESLSSEKLRTTEQLFYRRILTREETASLRQRLISTWNISSDQFCWWPITGEPEPPPGVVAFNDYDFAEHISLDALRRCLVSHGTRRVYKIDEHGLDNYEVDLDAFVPVPRGGWECYWFAEAMDWVIYISHEESITVGGELLLDLIQQQWPDWEEYPRTTHLPPVIPGLRGKIWYRTMAAVRGTPRRIFEAAVIPLAKEIERQANVRNARAWWDADDRCIVVELEHWGETGEKASQTFDSAIDAAVAATAIGWNAYDSVILDVQELS